MGFTEIAGCGLAQNNQVIARIKILQIYNILICYFMKNPRALSG